MIGHTNNSQMNQVTHPDAKAAQIKALIGPPEGWDSHVLRELEVAAGGYTMKHQHDWPHINYVLAGSGTLFLDGVEHPLTAGSIAYVPNHALHQFKASDDESLRFICIVPTAGHTY